MAVTHHSKSHCLDILVHASTDPLGEMEARLKWVISRKSTILQLVPSLVMGAPNYSGFTLSAEGSVVGEIQAYRFIVCFGTSSQEKHNN